MALSDTRDSDEDDDAPWEPPPPLPVTRDPFILLGVDRSYAGDASAIKSAYKIKAKAYHPDNLITGSTPEDVKRRITDDFSKINGAYESLIGGAAAAAELIRKTTAGYGGGSGAGYGFGAPSGAWFQTSFDTEPNRYPKASPYSSSGKSDGFVGFVNDRGWEPRAAPPQDADIPMQKTRNAAPRPSGGGARDGGGDGKAAGSEEAGFAAGTALSDNEEVAAVQRKCLALEEGLRRAELLVDATRREKEMLSSLLSQSDARLSQQEQTAKRAREEMALKHVQEKKALEERLELLEAEMKKLRMPWWDRPGGAN